MALIESFGKTKTETGEKAKGLGAHTALAEDPRFVSQLHTGQLRTPIAPALGDLMFWALQGTSHWCTYPSTDART